MSFNIVRGDIAQANTDAVVLPANPQLLEGPGSSHAIFEAAGWKNLKAACSEIGYCPLGSAVITSGFDLKAKNIIHAVCPRYIDGTHKEAELLYSAYKTSMQLAVDNSLRSIAFPLLSSGSYQFPKGEALEIANKAIRDFLDQQDDDFEVQLVIYDKEALRKESRYSGEINRLLERRFEVENRRIESRSARRASAFSMPKLEPKKSLEELVKIKQQSFCDLLNDYLIRSEMTNPEVYKRAMISKQVFSKAISGHDTPKKNTIFALAIALKLDLEDTEKLLMKAGYAFSDTSVTDIIVQFYIEKKIYDIMSINEDLYLYGEPTLGNAIA